MTPRQLYELRRRHIQTMQREELLIGILAATTANYGFCRPEKPLSAESFMLHPFPAPPPKQVTGEDIMLAFARIPKSGARPVLAGKRFA